MATSTRELSKYPLQPQAGITITFSFSTKSTDFSDRFHPQTMSTDSFNITTTVAQYVPDLEPLLATGWSYLTTVRPTGDCTLRYTVRIENVTAPRKNPGVITSPKHHYDGVLADGDMLTVDIIRQQLYKVLQNCINNAKY